MKKKLWSWILYAIGLLIIFGTHGWMLYEGIKSMPMGVTGTIIHAIMNLVAGILVVVASILRK